MVADAYFLRMLQSRYSVFFCYRQYCRSSRLAQWVKDLVLSLLWLGFDPWPRNLTNNHEVAGSIPGLAQLVEDPVLR